MRFEESALFGERIWFEIVQIAKVDFVSVVGDRNNADAVNREGSHAEVNFASGDRKSGAAV